MSINYTQLSKTIAHALRHKPWLYEIELNEEGWTSIEILITSLKEGKKDWSHLSKEDLVKMNSLASKKRYEIKEDKIRALYGHSLEQKILKEPGEPPEVLYHGTSEKAYEKIKESGLRPMSRQYVHLSLDTEMAGEVGRRKAGKPLILKILTKEAVKNGVTFYKGNDSVWLSEHIPPEYIKL